VHAPQHYTNLFCPCGEYSFQRDYISRHQRIARCHTGRTFVADAATFPEFRDLITPHVGKPRKRTVLARGFPACQLVREASDREDPPAADQPVATQPLWVVLDRVDNRRPDIATARRRPHSTNSPARPTRPRLTQPHSRHSPSPSAHTTRPRPSSTSSRLSTMTSHLSSTWHTSLTCSQPTHTCPHEEEIRRLRRRLWRCEEDVHTLRRQLRRSR